MADEDLPVVARFEVHRRGYLAPDGTVQRGLPDFAADAGLMLSLYRGMALTRARTLAPNSATVADTLGWFKLQQKDAAGALALLQRAHALQPGNGQITYHLAAALDANAKKDEARRLLQPLLTSGAKFPDRPAALQLSAAMTALR